MIIVPIITGLGALIFGYQSYKQNFKATAYNIYAVALFIATVGIVLWQYAEK